MPFVTELAKATLFAIASTVVLLVGMFVIPEINSGRATSLPVALGLGGYRLLLVSTIQLIIAIALLRAR
jgi:hypothetical protein